MNETPILLAEDSDNDAVFFARQLKLSGILNPLQVVSDGEEAIDYLFGNGKFADRIQYPLPTIVFLDLRMPKISGYHVLSLLRATMQFRDLPIIALSCMHEIKDVGEAYQRGANSFLMKPIQSAELRETVRSISSIKTAHGTHGLHFEIKNESSQFARAARHVADLVL